MKRAKKSPTWLIKLDAENTERALAAVRKGGGWCCPGCASHEFWTHGSGCRAAAVAHAYGVDLLELSIIVRKWKEMKEVLASTFHPDSLDEAESIHKLPNGAKYVKLTLTIDEARRAGKLLATIGKL